MSDREREELEEMLAAKERETRYFERIAREVGDRRLQETEYLSRVSHDLRVKLEIIERQRVELARLFRKLKKSSVTDDLTGLLNRRGFLGLAEREFATYRRRTYGLPGRGDGDDYRLAMAVLDVDHFKGINDRYGHPAGDRVLEQMGVILSQPGLLRRTDVVGRYGGDEFIILLPDCGEAKAYAPLDRLRQAVGQTRIPWDSGLEISVTVSIGVSEANPRDADYYGAISRADAALYNAKDRGRDEVVLHSGE